MIRRVLDLGHERRECGRLRTSVTCYNRDVLFAVYLVADGCGIRHVVEAHPPQLVAAGVVVGGEDAVERAREYHATSGSQHSARLRGALTHHPHGLLRLEVDGLDAAVLPVTVRPRAQRPPDSR